MALALLSAAPLSQSDPARLAPKILAKDDDAFARALSRAGFGDLADTVLAAIGAAGGASGSVQADLLRLDLEQDQALREADPVARVEKLEALVKAREEVAAAHAGTPQASALLEGQLELYRSIGEQIASALKDEGTADPAALREKGKEILGKAVDELKARQEALDARALDEMADEERSTYDYERMINIYGLARTQYFRALMEDPGSYARTLVAEQALGALMDLQLDYADQLTCYEGYIYEGLIHMSLEALEPAASSFDEAIRLREFFEAGPSGVYQMTTDAADVVSSAVLQKMLLLAQQGDHAGAVALAADFMKTVPEPWRTFKGLAILAEQAEAYRAQGDETGVAETAKLLIQVDPNGPGGRRGRELLGEGGATTLGAQGVLRLAESSIATDPERAIALCQQALGMARGMPDADDFRTRAAWILGGLYQKRGGLHEAVVVWDTVAAAHPKGKDAPECLYRAIRGYLALQGRERRPLYKDLARERLTELTRLYPDHPLSSTGALIEGEQAEADGDYAGAASIYERVAAGTPSYEEALYRAGGAWSRVARAHFDKGVANEARKAVARAEELLKKARTELEAASTRTLDTNSQERLRGLAFGARTGLANLYLMKGVDRAKDVAPLFQGAEQELAAQPERMSSVWELRFRALNELGKLDEAMALFEAQVKENPAAEWLDSGARLLAPILDARGTELRKKDPRSAEADRLWRKAAANYLLAIQGQIEGRDAVQMETLEGVADRLFLFALHFEGLGETVESFVDHHGAPLSGEMLEATARAYELIVPLTPSYRTAIKLARTLGFLGRWDEASSIYAELFERESFADPVSKTINQEAVASKPELLFAYIEWGVSERNSATTSGENQRLVRASGIFEALVRGTTSGSKLWWQSKFYQLQTMFDRGEYEVADIAVKSLKLNWERYDSGEYGLEERFKKLEEELAPRVFEQKD